MTITNGTFDTNLNGWTNTIPSGGYYNPSFVTAWESPGKVHIRSGSTYGASLESFVIFWQRFLVEQPILVFDIQALTNGDTAYACGSTYFPDYQTCGWTLKDDNNNILGHAKPGTTLTTVSIDVSNHIGQYLTIQFIAGASRYNGGYYDLLVDNVKNIVGVLFNSTCSDTGQPCSATLYIDNIFQGSTPYHAAPTIGMHNYSLFRPGYDKFTGSVDITSDMIMSGATIENILNPGTVGTGITNGTFDVDISGWNAAGAATWDNGRIHLTNGGSIYQDFTISDNALEFDWQTNGAYPSSGFGYQLYIDSILKVDIILPANQQNTELVYLGNHVGRNARILFHQTSPSQGWIDNVRISHTTGIYNGNFNNNLLGWEATGDVAIEERFTPPSVSLYYGGRIEQTFIINQCLLSFNAESDLNSGYDFYIDGVLVISKTFPQYFNSIESIDVSTYIGKIAKISFWCSDYRLAIDNVQTSVDAFGISVISYPPGADIYLDNNATGQVTSDTPIIVNGQSVGQHTITLRLAEYPDYTEIIDIVGCTTSYIVCVFAGCVRFNTSPPNAKICIDNIFTNEITPKTLCGYVIDSIHTYSLYLKDYRIETGTLNFSQNQGILVDKTLIIDAGSANFNITPNGAKIFIDGVDTGKATPDIIDNLPVDYHTYEIRLDGYYPLTGSFRSVVDIVKQISDSLQQIIGVTNGTFDTDLNGWIITSSNLTEGYVEWINGRAHLITNNIPISISQDFVATQDTLVFTYDRVVILSDYCDMGWSVIVDPDTPQQATIASYCGYGSGDEYWGNFEVDLSPYIGRTIRLIANLTGTKVVYIGGPAEAYLDNVGNIPKPRRSITFESYCTTEIGCEAAIPQISQCPAEITVDGNIIGYGTTIQDLAIGSHSWQVLKDRYYIVDNLSKRINGSVNFIQGTQTHVYIDNIYTPATRTGDFYLESLGMVSNSSCFDPLAVHLMNMPGIYFQGTITYSWDVYPGYAWAGVYTQIFKNTEPIGELHDTGLVTGGTYHYDETIDILLDAGDTLSLVTWGKGRTYSCEYYGVSNVTLQGTSGLANIIATAITPGTVLCVEPCNTTVDITWTNNGVVTGTFIPTITVNGNPMSMSEEFLDPGLSATRTFSLSGLTAGDYNICADPNSLPCVTITVNPLILPPTLTLIEISPSVSSILIGDTQQFTAICRDENNNIMDCPVLIWSVVDPTLGTISDTGLFTGISAGTTTVTAINGDIVGHASATVTHLEQAGIGPILLGGLLIGLLIDRCKDQKNRSDCLKTGCLWSDSKCYNKDAVKK